MHTPIVIDIPFASKLSRDPEEAMHLIPNQPGCIRFRWPSFLAYLRLNDLFSSYPLFDESNPLFVATISTMQANSEEEVVSYIFDTLFAEHLTRIKNMPQLQPSFILDVLDKNHSHSNIPVLQEYLNAFEKNAPETAHNLILTLAWDRMCVSAERIFSYPSEEPLFLKSTATFKDLLIESFQHINKQKKAQPSLYRLVEALLFYGMREENLSKHSEEHWELLSQAFPALRQENALADVFYVDDSLRHTDYRYVTADTSDQVSLKIAIADYLLSGWEERPLRPEHILSYEADR